MALAAAQLYFLPLREVADLIERLTGRLSPIPGPHLYLQGSMATTTERMLSPEDARLLAIRALTEALRSTLALTPDKDPLVVLRSVTQSLFEGGMRPEELDRSSRFVALGSVYTHMGDYARAYKLTRRALRVANEADDNSLLVAAGLGMGRLYYVQAEYSRALQWYSYVFRRIPHASPVTALDASLDMILAKHRVQHTYDIDLVMRAHDLAESLENAPIDPFVTPWLNVRRHLVFDLQSAIQDKPRELRVAEVLEELDKLKTSGK